ncbi:MAG: tripartite tricarboxylate transporter TctB family protein [Spirochaetales bacterium]|nr:tripartite tricarboxylate transporter TctB family protein [Spirochaetales bacterium]
MEERNMPRADFITSIGLIAFGIVVLVLSIQMPRFEEQGVNRFSVPGIVPGFLGSIVAVLGLVLFIRSIIRKGYKLDLGGAAVSGFFKAEMTKRFAVTILVSVAYGWGMIGRVNYEVATALYIFAFIVIFDVKWRQGIKTQWKKILIALIIAILVGGIVGTTFRRLFLVNLPGPDLF